MSKTKIKIGDKNKINGSFIGTQNIEGESNKKSFTDKHPILVILIIPFLIGFILLFPFWDSIVKYVGNLFK
ncbi:hypothetical protein [Rummeliibacillus pycnus]|uniref:hypothetical protein n=1 Tax=Rummeliibacillus pycnus TaxID=101070 RepID=UPI003D2DC7BC